MTFAYFSNEHECNAHAGVLKSVACEACQCEYEYVLEREGVGDASSPYLLDEAGAAERAKVRANKNVLEQLSLGTDVVPCPACGHVQKDMIPVAQAAMYAWMTTAAVLSGFAFACLLITFVAGRGLSQAARFWAGSGTVVLGGAAFGLAFGQKMLQQQYNPNQTDINERKSEGKNRAARAAELGDRLPRRVEPQCEDSFRVQIRPNPDNEESKKVRLGSAHRVCESGWVSTVNGVQLAWEGSFITTVDGAVFDEVWTASEFEKCCEAETNSPPQILAALKSAGYISIQFHVDEEGDSGLCYFTMAKTQNDSHDLPDTVSHLTQYGLVQLIIEAYIRQWEGSPCYAEFQNESDETVVQYALDEFCTANAKEGDELNKGAGNIMLA